MEKKANAEQAIRIRALFEKRGDLRFIGHLDLMQIFQLALVRSGLPLRYSEGFNPHPTLSLPVPLSMGLEGERELLETAVTHLVPMEEFEAVFNRELPPGLKIFAARPVPSRAAPVAVLYAAPWITPGEPDWKTINAMPSDKPGLAIGDFLLEGKVENEQIYLKVALRKEGTLKPATLCAALGISPFTMRRTAILPEEENVSLPANVAAAASRLN